MHTWSVGPRDCLALGGLIVGEGIVGHALSMPPSLLWVQAPGLPHLHGQRWRLTFGRIQRRAKVYGTKRDGRGVEHRAIRAGGSTSQLQHHHPCLRVPTVRAGQAIGCCAMLMRHKDEDLRFGEETRELEAPRLRDGSGQTLAHFDLDVLRLVRTVPPLCTPDIDIGGEATGRVEIELFAAVCPKTRDNFRALCTG